MSANPATPPQISAAGFDVTSHSVVVNAACNELVFAVVGHAGSGTSEIANALAGILEDTEFGSKRFEATILSARDVICEWAEENGEALPKNNPAVTLEDVKRLQDLGDLMRAQKTSEGEPDHAAVARALIGKIRATRAHLTGVEMQPDRPVLPDGNPRAYVLDALRHPEEVRLLRRIYGGAFILVGVVCEEERCLKRVQKKYDAGETAASAFMGRDAGAQEPYGQHVNDAFHLSDFYVDNTPEREIHGEPNPAWDINEHLSRLVKILIHSELMRPTSAETAMYHASIAAMRSACLSRQVGAALVDREGTILATGTNEVPKAGGGVYGEGFSAEDADARCAFRKGDKIKFCRNTREQNEIINELIEKIPELSGTTGKRREELSLQLRRTRIGELIEFSRAVHAEMDAIISAARAGATIRGTRLFVTTFPCHYCAPHIITAGVEEVQYIEPYPKSKALALHDDAIQIESTDWKPPSKGGTRVMFRPFSGVAPRLYERAFQKDRDLKNKQTGLAQLGLPRWGEPWHLGMTSYVELEAELLKQGKEECRKKPTIASSE